MNTHLLALQLMAAQGALGAFDTLYHHELTEALPHRLSARRELAIHSVRALIYCLLFSGLCAWSWHGAWALVLLAVFAVEIVLTLWDFVVEDQTRLLPASERITHTVLAINGGAFITLLALNTPAWLALPTALEWSPHGSLSMFLAVCAAGVGISGLRDGFAWYRLGVQGRQAGRAPAISFGSAAQEVLVTGATGFIGKALVEALLAHGHHVTVLTRQPKQAAWLFDGKVRCIASMDELHRSQRLDVIVNLAGARILGWRWTAARRAALLRSRVGTTLALSAWMASAERAPRLLLSASAIGYYGIQAQGDQAQLAEEAKPQAIFMSRLCQQWEEAAGTARAHGVKVACMRFGMVLGRQGALPMMLLPVRLGLGGPLDGGRQWLSWIHLDDVLRGMAHLWHQSETDAAWQGGAYNFAAPEAVSQGQFSRIAASILRRPALFPTPGFPLRVLLGEQADLLLEGQNVIPARLHAEGFAFRFPALRGALDDLV